MLSAMLVMSSLVPALTTESYAKAFAGKKGDKYTVHFERQITYGPGKGGYSNALTCDLDDSLGKRYSYCVQPKKPSPIQPQDSKLWTEGTIDKVVTDEADTGKWNALRNICYYAPSYPGYKNNVANIKNNYYTGNYDTDWGIAHLALSYVYEGRPDDLETFEGTHASDLGSVWTKAKALGNAMWKDGSTKDEQVPDAFKVFICFQKGIQDMLVGYIERGTVTLKKSSSNPDLSDGKKCYSLKGAKYVIKDKKDKVVGTLVTDERGNTGTIELDAGDYTIEEIESAQGYALNPNKEEITLAPGEEKTVELTDDPENDPFSVILNKMDRETGLPYALGGTTLKGAHFKIRYYDAFYSDLSEVNEADFQKEWILQTDEKGKIRIPKNEEDMEKYFVSGDEFNKAKDGLTNTFALGSYTVLEVDPPAGYLINPEPQLAVVTGDPDSTTEVIETYNMLTSEGEKIHEQAERGDLTFVKKGIDEERLANCVFEIKSATTGEAHIAVTDPNGRFTTVGTVNPSTVNKNDEALNPDGTIDETKLNFRNKIWFGNDQDVNFAEPNPNLRPITYDTYIITELPCQANDGKSLITTKAVIYEDGYFCDLGTITDADIGTTLTDKDGYKLVVTEEETTLVDTVRYEKLTVNKKYIAEGTLMDKETGNPLEVNGEVVKSSAEFTPKSNKGTVDVEFTFNTLGLEGVETVAFEEIYKLNDDGTKGDLVATHKDINDEGQTIKFIKVEYDMYKVRTTDAPTAIDPDGKFGFAKGEQVDYDVIVSNTGDIDLTMDVTDNFEDEGYFSVPVVSKVTGATWNNEGKNQTVANITVKAGEKATVTFTAKVEEAPVKLADTAKDSDSKFKEPAGNSQDNNNQSNEQAPAEEDEGVDCNMKDQTNEPVDDGWTNKAVTSKVTYVIEGDERNLEDKDDIAQTPIRPVPEIGTYLTADAKKKTVASEETKFVDTVSYKGLTPGNTYIMEGTLMVKETNDPIVENGEPITVQTTFVPEEESGTTTVEFIIDTTGLQDKEIVAFETCYNTKPVEKNDTAVEEGTETPEIEINREIANHKDIDDEAQTAFIKEIPKKAGPKTGDTKNILIYLAVIVIGACSGIALYARNKKKAVSKDNK